MYTQANSFFIKGNRTFWDHIATSFLVITVTSLFFISSCDLNSEAETELDPLAFEAKPSDNLRSMASETPSDFTWEFFGKNIVVSLTSEVEWEGDLVLSGFQIANGEIVDRMTTEPHNTTSEELLNGLSSENFFSTNFTITDWSSHKKWEAMAKSFEANWEDKSNQYPLDLWEPKNSWTPVEIEAAVLEEFETLGPDTLYVVYARLANEASERSQTSRPMGILMGDEES